MRVGQVPKEKWQFALPCAVGDTFAVSGRATYKVKGKRYTKPEPWYGVIVKKTIIGRGKQRR